MNGGSGQADGGAPAEVIALRVRDIRASPVETVRIGSLVLSGFLRVRGEDHRHVRRLAEADSQLPPIVVHKATMKVVDGRHRVRAALLRGREEIRAQFLEGSEKDAYLFAVAVNTTHGLPLSTADRAIAAERILASHPQWSDRAVAAVAGLAAGTVSGLRRKSAAGASVGVRIGRDGRARPVNCVPGRVRASELIRQDPGASLRKIASAAGISPATVADVRDRLRRGVDPLPAKLRGAVATKEPAAGDPRPDGEGKSPTELLELFEALRKDPSLRFTEGGREVLRLLDACATAVREQQRIITAVPAHCRGPLAELMRGYGHIWQTLGERFDRINGVV